MEAMNKVLTNLFDKCKMHPIQTEINIIRNISSE